MRGVCARVGGGMVSESGTKTKAAELESKRTCG
jgi:hypothetical protein